MSPKGSRTYALLKLDQKDYELLIAGIGLATGYALKWDVYGLSGSDVNAVSINTKLLDLMNRIMEAKDIYHEHQEGHEPKEDVKLRTRRERERKQDKQDKHDRQDSKKKRRLADGNGKAADSATN